MKYKLTDETKQIYGRTLHRIVCVTAFASVNAGEVGGWVESESNLTQDDNAWVYGDAKVCGNAKVSGDAKVYDNALVSGDAKVYGNAWVYDNALVSGDAEVCGDAKVYGNAKVSGDAKVYDKAWVYGNAWLSGDAKVYDNAWVSGDAKVCGDAEVYGNADYIVIKNNWSSGRYFTYTASNDKWKVGCFYGSGEELIAKAYRDSELSGDCYKAAVEFVEKIKEAKKKAKATEGK